MIISIRTATLDDAETLLKIYAPYILNTAITFEYDVPSVEEFRERIKNFSVKYPYLVAEIDGEIIGYSYAHTFIDRKAYDHAAEMAIYLAQNKTHSGVGKKLYLTMEELLKAQGVLNLYACVTYTDLEDKYLTRNSVDFHAHLGYKIIGKFNKCGYKFNCWYDMVYMEKVIGEHNDNPKTFITFNDLPDSLLDRLNINSIN